MVSNLKVKEFSPHDLHLEILPIATRKAFLKCTTIAFFARSKWYLAGGTALGLQVAHRQSVDLDFFTPEKSLRASFLERQMLKYGDWVTSFGDDGTLYGKFMAAKVSFIAYPFFKPSKNVLHCGTLRILKPDDIAAMKIMAVSQRGRKRDFIDLYWYCVNREPLSDVIKRALKQYPGKEHNIPHILKSLNYFEDAEADPMPKVFFDVDWHKVKAYFNKEVSKITKDILEI